MLRDRRIAVSAGITAAAIAVIGSSAVLVDRGDSEPAAPDVQPLAESVDPTPSTTAAASQTSSSTAAPTPAPNPAPAAPPVNLSTLPPGPLGVPGIAMAAYQAAADRLAVEVPGCGMDWTLLAGIGQVETNHGYGQFDDRGNTLAPILGPRLDGTIPGTAIITDTDHGELDGDTEFDRAVGPVQFIPQTWRTVGKDANGDGKADPNNIFDSAYSTAHYLCASGGNMSNADARTAAILSYNNNQAYVVNVNAWAAGYATGIPPRPEDLPVIHPPVPPTPEKCPDGTEGTPEGPEAVENQGTPEEKIVVPGCQPLPQPPTEDHPGEVPPPPAPPAPQPGPDPVPGPTPTLGGDPAAEPSPVPSPAATTPPAGPGLPGEQLPPPPPLPFNIPGLPPLG